MQRTLIAVALTALAAHQVAGQCPARDNALSTSEFTCADGTRYVWMKYMKTTSWDAAQAAAIAEGGFLPNQVENTACISNQIGGVRYWVGIRDLSAPTAPGDPRAFQYTSGPRDGVAVSKNDGRWCGGEPNNCCGGEQCVVANWNAGSSCWNDWLCDGQGSACAVALVEFPTGGCFQEPTYPGSAGVDCVPNGAPERADPGATCTAGCPEAGYTLDGAAATLTCTVAAGEIEGSWTGAPPSCVPVECPVTTHPSSVANPAGPTVTYQSQVGYSCGAGYGGIQGGSTARSCQANGVLSGSPLVCGQCPENTFSTAGSNDCLPCAAGYGSAAGSTECQPLCPLSFEPEWLETKWEPVLDVADSGFLKYGHGADILSIVFDNADGYEFQSASIHSASEVTVDHGDPADDVSASGPGGAYTNAKACYTRYEVHSVWGDVEPNCASAIVGNFLEYTCKLTVENKEQLDPIRQTDLTRTIISEIPYVIRFPRQVSTSISGLSAFQPPNVLAAIVRQEVIVNVNSLTDLSAKIKLYTSVQWPFKLASPVASGSPTDIAPISFALDTNGDCADPAAGDVANPTVDDANACGQIWLLDLDVANGAAAAPCELDGDYEVKFAAECQGSFPSDCPLVQDDQGQIQNEFVVSFKIDSEYFCPQVVDSVDVSAELGVFKDFAHTIAATNFILGQTAYFVASVSSNKVTVVKSEVNTISIQPLGSPGSVLVYNVANGAHCDAGDAGDSSASTSLAVQDGPCENGEDAQAWFNFVIDALAIPDVPEDGSRDFSVSVVLDVEFKNAGGLLLAKRMELLQTFGSNAQQSSAIAQFAISGNGDETTSAAPAGAATCAALAATSAFAAFQL